MATDCPLRPSRRQVRLAFRHGEYSQFLRAYLACIACVDDLIGSILKHLADEGLSASTTIVVFSDHGWQLGEKLAFRKFTLWERALRVPFMIVDPGLQPEEVQSPVSLVEMAPTTLLLMGMEHPSDYEGRSLYDTGTRQTTASENAVVPSQWVVQGQRGRLRAFTLRSSRYRHIRY